ncbi:MAG TPA: hypothetical protein VMT96_01035 [Candidatus Bathyarchaeia archaeon]|nr:hypothetical protein [Candidatus Bathyarchaeia archaeon]
MKAFLEQNTDTPFYERMLNELNNGRLNDRQREAVNDAMNAQKYFREDASGEK